MPNTYRREDKEFKASIAKRADELKPFQKSEKKIVTVTIDEEGDVLFLKSDANDIFLDLGNIVTQRASHVEPAPRYERWAFHLLRALFGDKGRVADWTRGWKTLWRVNTKPVGGPILTREHVYGFPKSSLSWEYIFDTHKLIAVWSNRQDAIDAEIKFLNRFFLEGR